MGGSFEGQHNMDVIGFSQVPDLSTDVFGDFAFGGLGGEDGGGEFLIDDVNKFLMGFNSCSRDDDPLGGEVGGLEFLDDVGGEIVDVAPETLDGHSESLSAESCLEDAIGEDLVAAEEGLQLVGVGVLVHADAGGDVVLGFEGRISDHGEDIDDIVGEA